MKVKKKVFGVFLCLVLQVFILKALWKSNKKNEFFSCSKFPRDEEIQIDHEIWQTLTIPKGDYKIMNAYVDNRDDETVVRVMMAGYELDYNSDHIYCQFWFEDSPNAVPFVQKATEYFMMWSIRKHLYFISTYFHLLSPH
jgi:hypothetical protein